MVGPVSALGEREEVVFVKKISLLLAAGALVFALSTAVTAHDPPDFVGGVWAWPGNALPVLDGDLSEWDIVPPELWITEQDVVNSSDRETVYTGDIDVSSMSFRWLLSWNDETNRIYFGYERFDDKHWGGGEHYEGALDADHSGGTFWSSEGQSDEEAYRQRGRHAQIFGWHFDWEENWSNNWMTQADWYDDPLYTDHVYRVEGVPGSTGETRLFAEWYQIYWDDFNWEDPEGSIVHEFEDDQIIGYAGHVYDKDDAYEDAEGNPNEDCNCHSRWTLSPNVESFGNADFLADFLILPIDDSVNFVTAVEGDSWGRIKASLAK